MPLKDWVQMDRGFWRTRIEYLDKRSEIILLENTHNSFIPGEYSVNISSVYLRKPKIYKKFKTYTQALKFTKQYMRTH